MSPKIPPKAPQEGHAVEKNSAVTLRRNTIEPSQKISQNILNSSQKVDVMCQSRPQILLNDPLKMGAWCQKKVLVIIRVMPRTPQWISWQNIEQISRKISTYAKIGPKNSPTWSPPDRGHCLCVLTTNIISRTAVQNFMRKYWMILKK